MLQPTVTLASLLSVKNEDVSAMTVSANKHSSISRPPVKTQRERTLRFRANPDQQMAQSTLSGANKGYIKIYENIWRLIKRVCIELLHSCLGHLRCTSRVEITTEPAHFGSWQQSTALRVHDRSSNIRKCHVPLKAAFACGLIAEAYRAKDMNWLENNALLLRHFMVL